MTADLAFDAKLRSRMEELTFLQLHRHYRHLMIVRDMDGDKFRDNLGGNLKRIL